MKKLRSPFILIKKSFEIFSKKENLIFLLQIYLPLGILSLISLIFVSIPSLASFSNTSLGHIFTISINIIFFVVSMYVNAAGIIAIIKIIDGKGLLVKKTFREAFQKFWKFILLSLVLYLIYALGFILLIIPFFLVAVWFTFSKFMMLDLGLGIKKSLTESKKLTKGSYWKILIRLVVFCLFWGVSEMILGFLPYGIGVVVFYLIGSLFVFPTLLLYRELSEKGLVSG